MPLKPGFVPTHLPPRARGVLAALLLAGPPGAAAGAPQAALPALPKTGLAPEELAVVVNEDDPGSVRLGEYYLQKRGIPPENLLRVRFPPGRADLPRAAFEAAWDSARRQAGARVQAYALAWTLPYRVECMSITSAFAFGFDPAYCSARQCAPTKPSPYFDSASRAPYDDFHMRPAMLLAGQGFEEARRLVDRGAASDRTYPQGTGYLLNTSDAARSVRAALFGKTAELLGPALRLQRLDADAIRDKQDVLFYFTGAKRVEGLETLRFAPGAIADHLTSVGGALDGEGQMSSLRWLEAGATGSYGTVVEPCNHPQKFPVPALAMAHYAGGETLLEAYWKSVAWPGEGVFIGEPLARPYAPSLAGDGKGGAVLKVFSPLPKTLRLESSPSPVGPYREAAAHPLRPGLNEIPLAPPAPGLHYRLAY